MSNRKSSNHFIKIFLLLIFISSSTIHLQGCEIPLAVARASGATIGCGGLPYEALAQCGVALGSSFGPIGTIAGIIIGGLIGFLVNKCTRKIDHRYDNLWFNDTSKE